MVGSPSGGDAPFLGPAVPRAEAPYVPPALRRMQAQLRKERAPLRSPRPEERGDASQRKAGLYDATTLRGSMPRASRGSPFNYGRAGSGKELHQGPMVRTPGCCVAPADWGEEARRAAPGRPAPGPEEDRRRHRRQQRTRALPGSTPSPLSYDIAAVDAQRRVPVAAFSTAPRIPVSHYELSAPPMLPGNSTGATEASFAALHEELSPPGKRRATRPHGLRSIIAAARSKERGRPTFR